MTVLGLILATLTASTGLANIHFNAPPPDIAIPTASGTRQLSSMQGTPVVLNFWATWCPPCKEELHEFTKAKELYGDKIDVVTISNEAHDVAASYLRLWEIHLPVIEDLDGSIFKLYSVTPLPTTIVINREGLVSYVSVGELSWTELQTAINAALDETPAPLPTSSPGARQPWKTARTGP